MKIYIKRFSELDDDGIGERHIFYYEATYNGLLYSGNSIAEAIGRVVMSNQSSLGLEIVNADSL